MRRLQLTLLSFLLPSISWAESINEDYYFEDLPVVLSASRLEQPLIEATSSVTIIDQEMISASGANDIPELLRLVPGFVVGYADGNSPVATYHGLGHEYARHLQVLINGRPIYSPLFSGVFWADIPFGVHDIERIEVIRGPNSALYGSNSFNGVISITTKQAVSSSKSNIHTKIGNNNYTETYINQALLGEDWNYAFTLSRKTDDGFDSRNDAQSSNKIYATYNYKPTAENTITIESGYINGLREVGNDQSLDIIRDTDIENYFSRIKWEKSNANGDVLSLQYFYDKNTSDDIYSVDVSLRELLEFNSIDTSPYSDNLLDSSIGAFNNLDYSIFTVKQEIELTYQPHRGINDKYRYITGISTRYDEQNIKQYFNRDQPISTTQHRVFYNGEYQQDKFLFNLGIMLEDNEITGSDSMPKASILYRLSQNRSIRYTYSKASRSPIGLEEFSDYQGNLELNSSNNALIQSLIGTSDIPIQIWLSSGGLKREVIRSNELAYQLHSIKDHYNFDAKIFSNKIKNLISSPETSPIDFSNTDSLETTGYEVSFDRRFKHYRVATGYSKIKASGNDIGDEYTEAVPENIFFFYLMYNRNMTTLSSTLHHYSDVRMLDAGLTNDFTYLNIFYKYQTSGIDKRWLSLSANKLLNKDREYNTRNHVEKLFNIEIGFNF